MQEQLPFSETPIGTVTHYWPHLGVAGVHLTAPLDVGDHIHIHGHTSDIEQSVDSIQLDHRPIMHADPDSDIGLAVADHVREHDAVYRLVEPADMGADETTL